MLKLVLETTLPETLIALYNTETDELWEQRDAQPRASERLHSHIDTLLQHANATLSDVGHIVVTCGPGSFTGIRVGLAVAQAMDLAESTPSTTLTTLQALALSHPSDNNTTVVMDSLGQEVFVQTFDKNNNPLDEAQCLLQEEAMKYLADKTNFIGNGLKKLDIPTTKHLVNARTLAQLSDTSQELRPFYLKPLNYRKMTPAA
ncbi:MAG: tRNA (adenosine(37)-N6)-threonylcarbamoyltransferase complex dimerization subunit type 1 TsaB [Alphaproteobacteria bacterium]|nr:tRNA (adenosine(37)-N6)-threonylcarbamoyltransferase complex dimerization subunit type 1 TsaB [Alphaproteobacteria bacterium]MDD9919408.1 tRNA (adenosine(37)-N6)-threonylcarbamoyltransferase complex dimerization subunit type 1 TsaB [Alphaproteobacteria bacterium]